MTARRLASAVLGLVAAGALALGVEPASAATPSYNAAERIAGAAAAAAPRDVECDEFLGGTRIYCVHGLDGNVIAAMENYAGCRTEDSCDWVYRSNVSGPYAGDGYWMLVGVNP